MRKRITPDGRRARDGQRRGQSFRAFERTKNPGRVIVPVFRDIGFRAGVPGSCHTSLILQEISERTPRGPWKADDGENGRISRAARVNAKTRDLRVISNGYTWKACHPDEARKKCEKGAENRAVRKGGKNAIFRIQAKDASGCPGDSGRRFPPGKSVVN